LKGFDNLNIFSTSLDLFIYKYLLVKNIGVNKRGPKIYSPTFSSLIYNLMDKLLSLNIFTALVHTIYTFSIFFVLIEYHWFITSRFYSKNMQQYDSWVDSDLSKWIYIRNLGLTVVTITSNNSIFRNTHFYISFITTVAKPIHEYR